MQKEDKGKAKEVVELYDEFGDDEVAQRNATAPRPTDADWGPDSGTDSEEEGASMGESSSRGGRALVTSPGFVVKKDRRDKRSKETFSGDECDTLSSEDEVVVTVALGSPRGSVSNPSFAPAPARVSPLGGEEHEVGVFVFLHQSSLSLPVEFLDPPLQVEDIRMRLARSASVSDGVMNRATPYPQNLATNKRVVAGRLSIIPIATPLAPSSDDPLAQAIIDAEVEIVEWRQRFRQATGRYPVYKDIIEDRSRASENIRTKLKAYRDLRRKKMAAALRK